PLPFLGPIYHHRWRARFLIAAYGLLADQTHWHSEPTLFFYPELVFDQFINCLRISLAACGLHNLSNEPTSKRRLNLGLFNLLRVGSDNVINSFFDSAGIGNLFHAAFFYDFLRITTLVPD